MLHAYYLLRPSEYILIKFEKDCKFLDRYISKNYLQVKMLLADVGLNRNQPYLQYFRFEIAERLGGDRGEPKILATHARTRPASLRG